MAAKFETSKDHAGKCPLPPQGPERWNHRRQPRIRDEGECREGCRGGQDSRTRCHGGGPLRLAPVSNTHSCGVGVGAWSRGGLALVRTMTEKGGA